MPDLRFVFDTSTLISAALIPNSSPAKALALGLRQGKILASVPTLAELEDVLQRPKFDAYVSPSERRIFFSAIVRVAIVVPVASSISECEDIKDNKFLELAIDGNADGIVSSDRKHLVKMSPFRGIPIYLPADFLAQHS